MADFVNRPRGFGVSPDWLKAIDEGYREDITMEESFRAFVGEELRLNEFFNPLHPSVQIIPANRPIWLVDERGSVIGPDIHYRLPFSNSSFVVDPEEDNWVFGEASQDALWRLRGVRQLGYLTLPYYAEKDEVVVTVPMPAFHHVRYQHVLLSAILAEIILARAGFSKTERAAIVLTVLYHDVATPAGGDSTKRVDKLKLDEERNFGLIIRSYRLLENWQEKFGFDLKTASAWVRNEGMFGLFLDICDKMSYVAMDFDALGSFYNGAVRDFGLAEPLFMDVWEDLTFSPDRQRFAFQNPNRLYNFIKARALEHIELLCNPSSRVMDFLHQKLISPLYQQGAITRRDLLTWTDWQLEESLKRHYRESFEDSLKKHRQGQPEIFPIFNSSDEWEWRKFETEEQLKQFISRHSGIDHTEKIKRFNPGLDWPVWSGAKIVPLRELLLPEQLEEIEYLSQLFQGYYAYWRVKPSDWQ